MSRIVPKPIRGTISVVMTNPLVLTRVRYSRLMIRPILRTCRPIYEYFVQGRLNQFESRDADLGLHDCFQNFLGVGAGFEFGLNAVAELRDAQNCGMTEERVAARVINVERVLAVGLLDSAEISIENVFAVVDQADGIAHALDLFHAVRGKDDG